MNVAKSLLGLDEHVKTTDMFKDWVTLAVLGVGVVMLTTRFLSGVLGKSKRTPHGDTVPLAPYWIPLVGHIPSFLIFSKSFFARTRRTYTGGAFAINMLGSTHNIIFKPALGQMLMNQKNSVVDSVSVQKHIMRAIFCWPKREMDTYEKVLPDLLTCYKELLSNPGLSTLIDKTVAELQNNINSFVSFNESIVDQPLWERTADTDLCATDDGEQWEEVNLLHLTRNFVAATANSALLGTDFVHNNPDFYNDLWTVDNAFMYLATGLPRWFPIPTLTRGILARERLMRSIRTFEHALDKWAAGEYAGSEWSDLDNISSLLKTRAHVYRKNNMSIEARSATELALIWAMNANANPLIFWILTRVYADATLLEQIREEVAPFIKVRIPKQEFAVPEPPHLEDVDHDGLANHCPLLKAAYVESLRLDTSVWSFKIMREDVTLTSREKDAQKFLIKKDTFCHVAHEMHHGHPDFYDEPDVWRVGRHIKYEPGKEGEPAVAKADMGNVRPYGGGHSMCKGRAFALKEILIFTATIFIFYDMMPAKGKWHIPKPSKTPGTNGVKGNLRVRIKRRNIAAASVR